MTADDLLSRIDDLLDDEETGDFPWSDSWRWAPPEIKLPEGVWEESDDEEMPDGGWEATGDCQIHVIPVEQVGEWTAWLATLPPGERGGIAWYVVCFEHGVAGSGRWCVGAEGAVDCKGTVGGDNPVSRSLSAQRIRSRSTILWMSPE